MSISGLNGTGLGLPSNALDLLTRQPSVSLNVDDYRKTETGLDGKALNALVNEPVSSLAKPDDGDADAMAAASSNAASLESLRMTDSVASLTSQLSKFLSE